ncbi:MAG: TIGR03915 family putative DNA repair protein [Clostridia bacterium]|nr:TIGR03915 family putative DNA repair protein [Clostridia bacterium]
MVYVHEDSFEGFLSAVFTVFEDKKTADFTLRTTEGVGLGFDEERTVISDTEHADRVINRLRSLGIYRRVYTAYLYGGVEDSILLYIKRALSLGGRPDQQRYDDAVKTVLTASERVGSEAHRFLEFIRFESLREPNGGGEIMVADIEPQYDILHIISNHFVKRFPSQPLLIRDMRRGKALVWDCENWHISTLPELLRPNITSEGEFEDMWRRYFQCVAIPWRRNRKLQQQFVPLRFRSNMTEFKTQ